MTRPLLAEMEQGFNRFEVDYRNFELKRNFTGKYDFQQCLPLHPSRRGGHREPGLGQHAASHVPALDGIQGLRGGNP